MLRNIEDLSLSISIQEMFYPFYCFSNIEDYSKAAQRMFERQYQNPIHSHLKLEVQKYL